MKTVFLFLGIFSLMACNSTHNADPDPVIFLENDHIRAGFLPEVGGRLVFLGKPGGYNLLKADSTLWRETGDQRMKASPRAGWKAYQGHVIWVGPQSEWWMHQDLNTQRRDSRAIWPPDPYLVYAEFKVLELTESTLVMEGPASPVSGITLTKSYSLLESGLEIKARMSNRSGVPVSWDIWSNARFEESTLFFVPGCETGVLKIDVNESQKTMAPKGEIVKSAFTFVNQASGSGKVEASAKAFLHPDQGRIVAVGKGSMLVLAFGFVEMDRIHPEQGFVEIYKKITPGGHGGLLELEHHSAYVNLHPGDSHELNETWTLYDYPGREDPEEAVGYYESLNH